MLALVNEFRIDPVCGERVDLEIARWQSDYLDWVYYFCSEGCKQKFDQRPEAYIVRMNTAKSDDVE